jgi:hypothetical protein
VSVLAKNFARDAEDIIIGDSLGPSHAPSLES